MKHPALARVFSVVLAVVSLLLLFTGAKGFGRSDAEYAERLAWAEKIEGRIENYRLLRGELDNAADYQQTMTALDAFFTAHERAASQHKTDTATYSAAKGGIRMGENMILAARTEIASMRRELDDAASRRAYLQGMISQLLASQRYRMPWLDALVHSSAEYAIEAFTDSAELSVVTGELRALMENEPTPSGVAAALQGPPQAPEAPVFPQLPNLAGASYEAAAAAWQTAAAGYQSAAAAWAQAGDQYAQQMQQYYNLRAQSEMERLYHAQDSAMAEIPEEAYTEEYRQAHALWEKECEELRGGTDLLHYAAEIRKLSGALAPIVRQANSVTAFLMPETGGIFPGLYELTVLANSTADRLESDGGDPASLSNEEFLRLADEARDILDQLGNAFSLVGTRINDPSDLLLDLMDRLELTETLVSYLDFTLERAEKQMQGQLEELWYQLGEQEKEEIRLEAEKLDLDREAEILSKNMMDADELKDLRNRHNTARQLLLSLPEVKSAAEANGDLAGSARDYLSTYERQTERLHKRQYVISILALVGGAMGVLAVPASYELVKKRFLLLAPVLLCLGCSAAAEGLGVYLGFGQQYAALFTAIFALLHLLIVLPERRRPLHTPQHLK